MYEVLFLTRAREEFLHWTRRAARYRRMGPHYVACLANAEGYARDAAADCRRHYAACMGRAAA